MIWDWLLRQEQRFCLWGMNRYPTRRERAEAEIARTQRRLHHMSLEGYDVIELQIDLMETQLRLEARDE